MKHSANFCRLSANKVVCVIWWFFVSHIKKSPSSWWPRRNNYCPRFIFVPRAWAREGFKRACVRADGAGRPVWASHIFLPAACGESKQTVQWDRITSSSHRSTFTHTRTADTPHEWTVCVCQKLASWVMTWFFIYFFFNVKIWSFGVRMTSSEESTRSFARQTSAPFKLSSRWRDDGFACYNNSHVAKFNRFLFWFSKLVANTHTHTHTYVTETHNVIILYVTPPPPPHTHLLLTFPLQPICGLGGWASFFQT